MYRKSGESIVREFCAPDGFGNVDVTLEDAYIPGFPIRATKSKSCVAAAFGWVHGSSAFQMTSDAIVHIMSKEDCKGFAYIDDFVIVSSEDDAWRHFNKLSDLFRELGLPMNDNKRSPPSRVLTCLGITIDLDNNTLSIEPNT